MLRISRKIEIYQEKFRYINKIWDISIIFEIYQKKTDYIKKSTYLVKICHHHPHHKKENRSPCPLFHQNPDQASFL